MEQLNIMGSKLIRPYFPRVNAALVPISVISCNICRCRCHISAHHLVSPPATLETILVHSHLCHSHPQQVAVFFQVKKALKNLPCVTFPASIEES